VNSNLCELLWTFCGCFFLFFLKNYRNKDLGFVKRNHNWD